MDIKKCMIIDLDKRGTKEMFITESVAIIKENNKGLWSVLFNKSQQWFHYNPLRLLYLTHPESIDLKEKGLYINKKHITNAIEVLRFSGNNHVFYHIVYDNGCYENLEGKQVYITRTPIDRQGGSTWDYLKKLAAETGLQTEEEESILSIQYEKVDTKRDNVPLSQYLGDPTPLATYKPLSQIYYPFGCNASQKAAVEAALTNQVSIIQGPPGTGKTQTILNIIANLLLQKKTILVVSNNNSAVENVAEKLNNEGLGFIVSQLGSSQNKSSFISNQKANYPEINDWLLDNPAQINSKSKQALLRVSEGFDGQLRQALLLAERDALTLEQAHDVQKSPHSSYSVNLEYIPSSTLLNILHSYRLKMENNVSIPFWKRLLWLFKYGRKLLSFLNRPLQEVIPALESTYYVVRLNEINNELEKIHSTLNEISLPYHVKQLRETSLLYLKNEIAQRCQGKRRKIFKEGDLYYQSDSFLSEYPVVLSTTYSAKSCIHPDMVFDYVIMDEASQVDIKTGALALSCALNAVIVGDNKQLPNVVSSEEAIALQAIQETYQVEDYYNAQTHSFLTSCMEIFKKAPVTLLREHYRCHPKIIEFCNRKFYNNELIAMTTDKNEEKVLQLFLTGKGNYAHNHINQIEIETIQKIMPTFAETESVGIITPYRSQAEAINLALGKDIASTVHKFQGRECDVIILSMVDNEPTTFSDDANLLNVAISRAKTKLCVVTNENEKPKDSIIAQLISYLKYQNCDIVQSKLNSVFDLLYKPYTAERLTFEANHVRISEHLSENLVYDVLQKTITGLNLSNIDVLCHYPLSRLIADWSLLDEKEKAFAENPLTHVDFLIYNSLTKQPIQTIEVDGWHFHQGNEAQLARDTLKDQLLDKFELRPHRISTAEVFNVDVCTKFFISRGIK